MLLPFTSLLWLRCITVLKFSAFLVLGQSMLWMGSFVAQLPLKHNFWTSLTWNTYTEDQAVTLGYVAEALPFVSIAETQSRITRLLQSSAHECLSLYFSCWITQTRYEFSLFEFKRLYCWILRCRKFVI